ncbi:MAG TPA: tetratricopeptide repeat protein [Phycisphaerae bacterium]|nr:tetratricopeptide repeat protein [Phycisphaerales bacterium]HRX85925.1 tetratricopeptide repeat protein [Phycisphaerae bacterium]
MKGRTPDRPARKAQDAASADIVASVRAHFAAQRSLRKGLCLLSAGVFAEAVKELSAAVRTNARSVDLSAHLVQALAASGRAGEAAEAAADHQAAHPRDVAGIVRLALAQWKGDDAAQAVQTLRAGVADHPESAELHFQLGTLLAALDQEEEAELRFVQAITIDKQHADALVALGLTKAARREIGEALRYLHDAQRLRPGDARIALLLAQAAQAAEAAGLHRPLPVEMPTAETILEHEAWAHLSRLIEREPEFVEAFLALDPEEVEPTVFELLALSLQQAIGRSPRFAALHYLRSRVLERLGRSDEAIAEAESAVDIDPRYVQALILLANLYGQTDRCADARRRLEETVALGVEYADAYYLLGNLYRDDGQVQRARWAYEQALRVNHGYTAARQALAALAA